MSLLLIALGILLLYLGGELLVRNAVHLAFRLGISALIVGLTVVAFGTSAPELATTLASALSGSSEIAVGNVIGSNIANLGLILGLTALIYPLQSTPPFLRREMPIMIACGLLLFPLLWDGRVGRLEGSLLLLALGVYLALLLRSEDAPLDTPEVDESEARPLWRSLFLLGLGIALLVVGARSLVAGAVTLARGLGVSETVIGLTLVAFGTSLPELASSVVAAVRRQTDIILGNLIGSNIFNVLVVLGASTLVQPLTEPFASIQRDLVVMAGVSVAVLVLMLRGGRMGRAGGALLLMGYVVYVVASFV